MNDKRCLSTTCYFFCLKSQVMIFFYLSPIFQVFFSPCKTVLQGIVELQNSDIGIVGWPMPNPISFPPLQPTYSANVFQRNIFFSKHFNANILKQNILTHQSANVFQQIFSILKQTNINPGWLTGTGQLFLMKSAPASNTSLSKSLLFNSDFQQDTAIFMVKKMMLLLDDVDRIRIKFRLF